MARAGRYGRLAGMRRPRLQSTFARAVVPVAAGIGFFAVLGLALWGVAALVSGGNANSTDTFGGKYHEVGRTDTFALVIADSGPIVFQDLLGQDRNIVLDHVGSDPQLGWRIYLAYPADRSVDCAIEQVRRTRTFTDCDGRTIDVSELALPPDGVVPQVSDDGLLTLDLRSDAEVAAATTDVPATGTAGTTVG